MCSFIICLMYILIGTNGQKFPKDKKVNLKEHINVLSLTFYLLKCAFLKLPTIPKEFGK